MKPDFVPIGQLYVVVGKPFGHRQPGEFEYILLLQGTSTIWTAR